MVKLWAVIHTLAAVTAGAVVVQGASLAAPPCNPKGDHGHLKCETSGGSPLVSDCQAALNSLANDDVCYQWNGAKSHCTTLKRWGTCKIDVCGKTDSRLYREHTGPIASCKDYLNNLLHDCQSGGVVGGQIFPQQCSVNYQNDPVQDRDDPEYKDPKHYRLQFSHI